MISDIVMPGKMSGTDLAQIAINDNPDLRVLLVSGFSGRTECDTTETPGNVAFLSKPFKQLELALEVRRLLDSKQELVEA